MNYCDSTSAIFSSDSEDKGAAVTGLQYLINMVLPPILNLVFPFDSKLLNQNQITWFNFGTSDSSAIILLCFLCLFLHVPLSKFVGPLKSPLQVLDVLGATDGTMLWQVGP